MKVVLDRNLCNASLQFCQRCSAALIRNPEGEDRLCIRSVEEDGSELLTLELVSDDQVVTIQLDEETREVASVEGFESLADFDPTLFRTGALKRWRQLRKLPTEH